MISVFGSVRWFPHGYSRFVGRVDTSNLLDRADPDSIRFAQCAIDSSGFCDSHFSTSDQLRDIVGIGISVSTEPFAGSCLECGRTKCPACLFRRAEPRHGLDTNSETALAICETQQTAVGHVPGPVEQEDIAEFEREPKLLGQCSECQRD